jgi:hypothetical protein
MIKIESLDKIKKLKKSFNQPDMIKEGRISAIAADKIKTGDIVRLERKWWQLKPRAFKVRIKQPRYNDQI